MILIRICALSSHLIDRPTSGGQVRVFEMLRHLVRLGNEVGLVVPGIDHKKYSIDGIAVTVAPYPWLVRTVGLSPGVMKLVHRLRGTVGYSLLLGSNPNMLRYAKSIIDASDAVLLFDTFQVLPMVYARLSHKVCIVDLLGLWMSYFVSHLTYLIRKPIEMAKLLLVVLSQGLIKLAGYVIVSCWEDHTNCVGMLRMKNDCVFLIPDGVDLDDFRPNAEHRDAIRQSLGIDNKWTVIAFLGDTRSPENYYAVRFIVEELAPKLASRTSSLPTDVRFLVIGDCDSLPDEWFREPCVIFTGRVDSVADFLNAADICVSPLSEGAGMKTKTLAYLACGKAVVTTPEGAEGLRLIHGRDALIGSLDSMESHITRLMSDRTLRATLEARAREKVLGYAWEERARILQGTLLMLLAHGEKRESQVC